jgi:hypothetical protein
MDNIELEFGNQDYDDDMTIMLDEKCQQTNHAIFEKYIGLNIYLVCIILQLLNPSKRVLMYNEGKIEKHSIPSKNAIIVFYNSKNKVTKIRYNSIKKIE